MYFKINTPQKDKYTDMGMVAISAAFYLEAKDEGYDKYIAEHYVQVPVIPKGGYQGKVGETGIPVDLDDYKNWIKSLPTAWQLNPFCNHSIQFEANVTEEEILWCFEWALAITHQNYLKDDLHCKKDGQVVNQDINYRSRKAFYEGARFVPPSMQTTSMKSAMAKCALCESKVVALKEVDFTAVKTIAAYRCK
jgi:hypothetical protein